MRTFKVRPVQGGWMVDNDLSGGPLVFTSGAAAERQAKLLAGLVAERGEQTQVLVQDRQGLVVGSSVVGPGRSSRS
jgi:hypothetical protein